MRESIGKKVARKMFYLEILPTWLSLKELRAGNFLVLLGEEKHELKLLQQSNIPPNQIWSVERDPAIHHIQNRWDSGVSLYCGEMVDYLRNLLHHDEDLLVLNLDIEGSYLSNLDPAMTSVLLFSWKNPETVIATYSTAGRDNPTLKEGVLSLATLMWLAPDIAMETSATLFDWFKQTGFSDPMTMVLREMFWIRSLLEHTILASVIAQKIRAAQAREFLEAEQTLWKRIIRDKPRRLNLGDLSKYVQDAPINPSVRQRIVSDELRLGITIEEFRHIFYNAHQQWSQLCHFVKLCQYGQTWTCREWLETVCGHMLVTPLTYVNRLGKRFDIDNHVEQSLPEKTIIWKDRELHRFKPRRLVIQESVTYFDPKHIVSRKNNPPEIISAPQEATVKKKQNFVEQGKLSDIAKVKIAELAKDAKTDTDSIMKIMDLPKKLRGSVTATLAIARRRGKK